MSHLPKRYLVVWGFFFLVTVSFQNCGSEIPIDCAEDDKTCLESASRNPSALTGATGGRRGPRGSSSSSSSSSTGTVLNGPGWAGSGSSGSGGTSGSLSSTDSSVNFDPTMVCKNTSLFICAGRLCFSDGTGKICQLTPEMQSSVQSNLGNNLSTYLFSVAEPPSCAVVTGNCAVDEAGKILEQGKAESSCGGTYTFLMYGGSYGTMSIVMGANSSFTGTVEKFAPESAITGTCANGTISFSRPINGGTRYAAVQRYVGTYKKTSDGVSMSGTLDGSVSWQATGSAKK